ncbi:hypothetical protein [Thermoactinomyces mirandus]|uniref:Uncharacterized protein n=1 Tax=Thermoactinomyces mirandus TaxID=2756294 RepID=A0A7W2AQW6_9BACL|nr:hypothetical protein [Thermoactinomyces mirandus]MBA4600950.1 hypothetical protein [Thermoactinomyces mirandus]
MPVKYMFGYFRTIDAARQAAEELEANGFEVYVDRFSPIGGGKPHDLQDEDSINPFQKPSMSLTESTLGGPDIRQDSRILRAVHPDASGMSGGQPLSSLEDISVTVFFYEEDREKAEQILKKHGARD